MKKVYLVAVVLALIAGFATYLFAQEIEKNGTLTDAEKQTVVVAIADIPVNTAITVENSATYVVEKEVVKSYVLGGAKTSINDVVGTVTRENIYAGEQITENKLITGESEDASLSLTLPKGYKAYSINASGVTAVDNFIEAGDTVNILVVNGGKTSVAMENLQVLKISNHTTNATADATASITDYSTLTFIVTEEQAKQLYEIEQMSYKLVLNPRISSDSKGDAVIDGLSANATDGNIPASDGVSE